MPCRAFAYRPVAAIRVVVLMATYSTSCQAFAQTPKWVPDNPSCGDKGTTLDVAACLDARAAFWDRRLNQAYQALSKIVASMPDAGAAKNQQEQLKKAQRLWLQYRSVNCGFYAAEQGTIRQIDAAECMRRMTQDRAIELQEAGPQ